MYRRIITQAAVYKVFRKTKAHRKAKAAVLAGKQKNTGRLAS